MAPEVLDQLLAPIALYPDALVIQVITCAGNPQQVTQVNEWLKANPNLKGAELQEAASAQGFDESFVAIVLFPQVLQKMAEQPDWTQQLGDAFTNDRKGVFASIQRLRKQAQEMGNLATGEQQKVETVATPSGQPNIVIQPANPEIVYVPTVQPAGGLHAAAATPATGRQRRRGTVVVRSSRFHRGYDHRRQQR